MKYTRNILIMGLQNPRYYIEAFKVKGRHILLLSLLAVLFMTIGLFRLYQGPLNSLVHDISQAETYLPDFTYEGGELNLAEGSKPLYYQSDTFQLVIDPTIEATNSRSVPLTPAQEERIQANSILSLYLFKNNAFMGSGDIIQPVFEYDILFANDEALAFPLQALNQHKAQLSIAFFGSLYLSQYISYWVQMFLIAVIAGLFNLSMTRRIPLKNRIKLSVIISFVPIILIELVNFFIPGIYLSYTVISFITILLMFFTFRNHTRFIQQIMRHMNIKEVDSLDREDSLKDTDEQNDEDDSDDTQHK
ncbi:DUF1189 family protein [Suicoccus acidiformans]|uniref:DUF1189 family protein n=1 Tax=Suicoccus acidiformans TaxID=2036206 RepID=UPI0013C2E18D|nr:DUF1189 family protein [Suicoccus acidiformans]